MHQSASVSHLSRGLHCLQRLFASPASAAAGGMRPMSVYASSWASPGSVEVEAEQHQQPGGNLRKVPLDFNEVRLVGRVAKVLDLGPNRATFVLTTQRMLRNYPPPPPPPPLKAPDASEEAAEGADATVAAADAQPAYRTQRAAHLVMGNLGNNDTGSWQQYLYPGSRVEVFGFLSYRPQRRTQQPASADPDHLDPGAASSEGAEAAAAPAPVKFEPVIRMSRISPADGSAAPVVAVQQPQPWARSAAGSGSGSYRRPQRRQQWQQQEEEGDEAGGGGRDVWDEENQQQQRNQQRRGGYRGGLQLGRGRAEESDEAGGGGGDAWDEENPQRQQRRGGSRGVWQSGRPGGRDDTDF